MVKKSPSKDETLEALDFIINVLKEHEKDLDRLIGELSEITSSLSSTGELGDKIESVEGRLSTLQTEVTNLIGHLASPSKLVAPTVPTAPMPSKGGPPVIIRCKRWDEFKVLANNADTVSFLFRESEKGFQVDALKDGRVLTYSGELPKDSNLLKMWLAGELDVNQGKILEGILTVG